MPKGSAPADALDAQQARLERLQQQEPDAGPSPTDAGAAAPTPATLPLVWQPLPRVRAGDLSYERFLREFALPKQPFILEGASEGWLAATRWVSLEHFQDPSRVNQKQRVSFQHHMPYVADNDIGGGDA